MRVLLLNEKRTEREAMIRALPAGLCRVEAVSDEQTALTAITRESPQVIVFAAPTKGGPDLVRRLRGADSSGQAYLLAVLNSDPPAKDIQNLIAAGTHDFLRRPVLDAELVERVKAPARLVSWARSVGKPAVYNLCTGLDLRRLRAWQNLGALVAEDLSQIAGQPFSVSEGWPSPLVLETRSATIPMSLAGDRLEMRISVVADSATLTWLKTTLLGDASANDEAADDILRELANTAGGAVKRAAFCENVTLTTGLPLTDREGAPRGDLTCWGLTLDSGDGCIAIVGDIRTRENQRVPASDLAEGMVLAYDVRNDGGILLVPAGSRLTCTTAAKLAQMLGPRFFLEVAPAE